MDGYEEYTGNLTVEGAAKEVEVTLVAVPKTYEVSYTADGEVTAINPETVTFATDKFTVPAGVTEFTFKDGDKEMKATYNETEEKWEFVEVRDVTSEAELRKALLNKVEVINLKADITITAGSGTPHIYSSVTINGNGYTINGSNRIDSQDAALYITPENKGDVIINNVKLESGSILVASDFSGSLTVKDSVFNGKYGVFACNGKISAQSNTFTGERGLTLEAPTKIGEITGNTFNVSVRGISYGSTDVPTGFTDKEAYAKNLMAVNEFGTELVEDIQKVKWQY